MNRHLSDTETAAIEILRSTGVGALEAALMARDVLAANRGQLKRARRCLAAGVKELRKQEKTVTFEKAVEAALEARVHRRVRTVNDFRYFARRFMKRCPGLARRRVRAITSQECAQYIEMAFDTPRQRQKARLILSGVFGTAVRRGWCSCIAALDLRNKPWINEKLSARPASHLPPTGKPSAGHLPAN